MFGIDSPELLVIAIVALVFIGPKELPGLLKTWGKWMSQMRGMAAEFRGHVDEMVRQSELDEVKKQIEASTSGVDLKALDPTKQMRETIQEGMAEGQKAITEAKSSFDNPMAEPESAPQVAAEPAQQLTVDQASVDQAPAEQTAAEPPTAIAAETPPASAEMAVEHKAAESQLPQPKPIEPKPVENPAKEAAE
jgi:sec-independent protein translocase protein TatB